MIDNDAADDVDRSDLASCHLCATCVKHKRTCIIEASYPVLECVEYQPKEDK